ncbi:signal transduction histidine kinase [Streptomyces sp. V3I8]|uniref:ATP-binding protein n=1 Tax=Streptomyces sp. V3I8 TaxID=3042279 RepID=UPI00278480F0|nr:signal transduction histidine kinase [Streptomyces sp. V3I8]
MRSVGVGGDSGGRPDARAGMSTAMPLNGGSSCIAEARRLAVGFLGRARAERNVVVSAYAVDLTQLVVSELVTNARKHAPGPALLELRITGTSVEVTVRDSARRRPVVRAADPRRVGQHGLEIVTAVAERFRVRLEPSGKRITAHIALTDASDGSRDDTGAPTGLR